MTSVNLLQYEPWPALPYDEFQSTQYLLHRVVQAIGKLKLATPFEPHWANVTLFLTSQGLTTGLIPYQKGIFNVDANFIDHHIIFTSSWGDSKKIKLHSMSVAQFISKFLNTLNDMGIIMPINLMPQEIPNPIEFDKDLDRREYRSDLVKAWQRIMLSSYQVMQRYHSRFYGITPPIGLMWGTLDLRDARYKGKHIPTDGPNSGYIRRNAMDDAQVEVGWWSGSEQYPRPAYFSFIYPEPNGIEQATIQPSKAHWDNSLREFILDYDDVRTAKHPDQDLLNFFESTYAVEAEKAGWEPGLVVSGNPV
ncbi:MAG: hypothetical protein KIT56_04140 [Gammaproteobacteria bacterium]|nr:hypothetical protein [Gammaproteobacteria bacterium]MCW5583067.1 hypothetical protein [Gammaproteobacteria bacterium]